MISKPNRFIALDIFRGLTICLMIVVNSPGDWDFVYPPLKHADWHGFTITDLVFPSFLFAIGNAMAFVQIKWLNQDQAQIFKKIIKRTLILFLLGYTMYWLPFMRWTAEGSLEFYPVSDTRIFGVLQRIALCYFAVAMMIYYMDKRKLFISGIILLLWYWAMMYFGGDLTLEGNFVRDIDLMLFGERHLYHGDGIAFDPEGLLSTLPSIVNVLAGYLLGKYLIDKKVTFESLSRIMVIGFLLILGAYFWHHVFPFNKKLWTSSFVTLTIGLDMLVIGVIMYFSDLGHRKSYFNFFEVFGKNSLAVYLFSEYLAIGALFIRVDGETSLYSWIYQNIFKHAGDYFGSFLFAICFMLICWGVARWLDRRNIYIKV